MFGTEGKKYMGFKVILCGVFILLMFIAYLTNYKTSFEMILFFIALGSLLIFVGFIIYKSAVVEEKEILRIEELKKQDALKMEQELNSLKEEYEKLKEKMKGNENEK